MKKPSGLRLLAIVSDIHSGSTVALMPPALKTAEGTEVKPSSLQGWFWECWERGNEWLADLAGKDRFGVVLNGDMIEGNHHRTTQIISPSITDHVECAAQVLAPLVERAEKVWMTKGTECHVGDTEAALGERLLAERNPETGRRVFDRLTLDICGVRMVARHHVTTTSRPWLESNGLGMELASEQLNAVRNGEQMPRILAVAHRHVGGHIQTGEGLCIATPAWQGLTTHGHKVVGASRCKPGLYVLDWRGVRDGELPIVHRRIYEAPHAKAIAA